MPDNLRKKLYRALTKSDVNMLRSLIQQRISLAVEADDHFAPFLEAVNCGRNDLEILQLLYDNGADINEKDRRGGDTALHWATHRDADTLPWLIAHGANVHAVNKSGQTPFIGAIVHHHPDKEDNVSIVLRDCEALLSAGADMNASDSKGLTALHHATINDDAEVVTYLTARGAKIDATENAGKTALHFAVHAGHLDCVRELLKAGANVDARCRGKHTSLHILADISPSRLTEAHREICQLLLDAGANLELADNAGSTALCQAAMNEDGLIGTLLKAGADVNANNGEALRQAIFFEHTADAGLLLVHGADPHLTDPDDLTASLHIAAREWYEEGARLLLKHGTNIEQQNIDGETPLCVAVREEAENIAIFLLSEGANPRHMDQYGNTPLSWAKRKQNELLYTMIEKKLND
jgi:ankyrin repeat protein